MDIFGNPNIGNYALGTEKFAIVPAGTYARKVGRFSETLGVEVFSTNVAGSRIVGVFVAANSNALILPHIILDREIQILESIGVTLHVVNSKWTAWGNLILANDNGAVVDPRIPPSIIKEISEALGVEAVKGEVNRSPTVGSHAVATNKGAMCHPLIREEEKALMEKVLKVPVGTGTVNGGVPYVKAGIVANTRGAVVGAATSGPELMAVSRLISAQ